MRMIIAIAILALSTGCASRQAALTLTQAQKTQAVFQADMVRALNNAVKREAQLRAVMRDVALDLDSKDGTYKAADLKALVEKYQKAQMNDLAALEAQIAEHRKAFKNAQISDALIAAVQNYNANGLTASDVITGLLDAAQPGITDIINLLAQPQAVPATTTGGN